MRLESIMLMGQNKNSLLNIVLLLVLVIVTRLQELFTFLLPFRIALVTSVVAILLFAFGPGVGRTVSLMRIPQVKVMMVIYLLCLFSIPFSAYPRQSFEFAVINFPIILLFLFLLLYSVNSFVELRKVLWVFIVGVLLLALFTIKAGLLGGADRPYGSNTYDSNDIAGIIVLTLPLVYFFMKQVKIMKKLFLFCTLVTLIFTLILTSSRGGFLGLVTIMILLLFKDSDHGWVAKLAAIGILSFAFIQFAPDSYKERIATITSEQDYNRTVEGGRLALWKNGIQLMLRNPIIGVGAGAIETGMGATDGVWKTTHNSFIQIGGELGVGGFVMFIALLLRSISGARQFQLQHCYTKDQAGEYVWLAKALEVSLYGFSVIGFFISWAYSPVLLFLIALCGIMKKLEYAISDTEIGVSKDPLSLR